MEDDLIKQGAVGLANSVLLAALIDRLVELEKLSAADVYAIHISGEKKLANTAEPDSPAERSILTKAREDLAFRVKLLVSASR